MTTERHFTATGFVVHLNNVLLHWHPKVKAWLPPGGHIEINEDPVDAVLREITEETGLEVQIVSDGLKIEVSYPMQVPPPVTILIEDINDPVTGYHQHIDLIYFCRVLDLYPQVNKGWQWVSYQELIEGVPLQYGSLYGTPPPKDVSLLGCQAIKTVGGTT